MTDRQTYETAARVRCDLTVARVPVGELSLPTLAGSFAPGVVVARDDSGDRQVARTELLQE